MSKRLKYFIFIASTMAAVGVVYTLSSIMNMPETFDWEEDDE